MFGAVPLPYWDYYALYQNDKIIWHYFHRWAKSVTTTKLIALFYLIIIINSASLFGSVLSTTGRRVVFVGCTRTDCIEQEHFACFI